MTFRPARKPAAPKSGAKGTKRKAAAEAEEEEARAEEGVEKQAAAALELVPVPEEAAAAKPKANVKAASPPAVPAEKYRVELAELCAEFPDCDRRLMKEMVDDQGGDVRDVRAMMLVGAWSGEMFEKGCEG